MHDGAEADTHRNLARALMHVLIGGEFDERVRKQREFDVLQ